MITMDERDWSTWFSSYACITLGILLGIIILIWLMIRDLRKNG